MTREQFLLKQYEIFSERKLHFGKLFWQTPTIFIALCVFVASIIKDLTSPIVWWFFLAVGLLLMLISYIGYRHKTNEDQYEILMQEIEVELQNQFENKIFHAPLSKPFGARFITSLSLFVIGLGLFLSGVLYIVM